MPFSSEKLDSHRHADHAEGRGEIHLGDLAKAFSALKNATAEQQEMIANCLGFQLQAGAEPIAPTRIHSLLAAWNRPLLTQRKLSDAKPPEFIPKLTMPPVPEKMPAPDENVLTTDMTVTDAPKNNVGSEAENLINTANPLLFGPTSTPLPRKTLFPRATARGLVSSAVMRQVPGRDLDIAQLIQAMARQQGLSKLPVLPRLSARNGCQLLLDFSEALMPWWEDMQSLITQFYQILGEELCPVYEFDHAPALAVRWTENGDIPLRPIPGKPVIVASDFGVIQSPRGSRARADKAEWFDFVSDCKRRNTPVIALSPLLPERCPAGLDRLLALIHWNPATTAAFVKRLIAHSVKA